MPPLSYARHQFPPAIIQHAIWLYLRFTLSYRDVEELLAERGVEVSYETVRRWVLKFGPAIAGNLRRLRPKPSPRWHLDEMVIRVSGRLMYVWRTVDDEGEVLEVLVQRRRDKAAALKVMRKLLKKYGFAPTQVTTDKLRSYGAAFQEIGLTARHEQGRRTNNRAEVSHRPLRRRERKMQRFKSPASAQRFVSLHAAVYNSFNVALSTGTGFASPFVAMVHGGGTTFVEGQARYADVNADGRADLIFQNNDNTFWVSVSDGASFAGMTKTFAALDHGGSFVLG